MSSFLPHRIKRKTCDPPPASQGAQPAVPAAPAAPRLQNAPPPSGSSALKTRPVAPQRTVPSTLPAPREEKEEKAQKATPGYLKPRAVNQLGFGGFRRNQRKQKDFGDTEGFASGSAIFAAAERFSQEILAAGKTLEGFGRRRKDIKEFLNEKPSLYVEKRSKEKEKQTVKEYVEGWGNKSAADAEVAAAIPDARCAPECQHLRKDLDNYVEQRKKCAMAAEYGESKKSENFLTTVWASELTIGDLWLPGASAVNCFDDRFEYKVAKHPEEGLVYMFMSFKHFESVSYDAAGRTVSFRLPKTLRYFAKYYKPETRADHSLKIKFKEEKDATKFFHNVWNIYLKR
mmetsp:Transcript_22658/g.57392  ORF Transcript_22658/g.57392 Transcript_22658/m.57392 type:complete len:344 (+) Transcript_22658:172-1203(+)